MAVIPEIVRAAQRAAIEFLYEDVCTITVTTYIKDPISKAGTPHERVVAEDQPCRLSFSSVTVPKEEDASAVITQAAKLFIAPEVEVPPGSKVTVTRVNGIIRHYKMSGLPASYLSQQAIPLVADEGRA
jgi:hypothetical protein